MQFLIQHYICVVKYEFCFFLIDAYPLLIFVQISFSQLFLGVHRHSYVILLNKVKS
jgi:hypothetical protein